MDRFISIGRRGVLAAAAVTTAVSLLAGCSPASDVDSAAPTSGPASIGPATGTITVMAGAQDLTEEMIAEFKKDNPDVEIEIILTDPTRLNTMIASGNPPDIATGPATGSANWNARGLATDLTPYLEQSTVLREDDLQPVNDGFRWDGTKSGSGPLYGIVKDWSQDASLWYNTRLFDEAGVPHLSDTEAISYDELLEIAKQLTVKDGDTTQVHGLGLEWAWSLYAPMSAMVMQQGGSLFNDDLTEIDFTTPEARRAFQWYVDFAEAGVGPTSLDPLADGSDFSTFAAERMAITQDGYWFGGNFAAEGSLQTVKMAPAPTMGDTRVNPTYGGQGWWIPAKADNKDGAWRLMEYFMAGPPAVARASSGWGMPSLKSLMDKLPQELDFQKQAFAVAQNEIQFAKPLPDSPYITIDAINAAIDKALQSAIKGTSPSTRRPPP
ncbi:ABC transporter substrate-binding protein [Tessaracoccus defluvii]|uniref:Sugar ABC transporter substrate-binding protein n=1 Tax=Tessaracoccus defluvii TaxID=1285901 RepID=A0A7H0H4H5_9ACTN|nr:sugar ABC transporter substrate-binding protein [Tessaracoccus defluvii]QNP55441.1 sugar ABC transporter substrate-binding protein [Tessaracoccus defluvii]